MARIYKQGGEIVDYPPPSEQYYSLDELRAAIGGGYIEVIYLDDGEVMVIDEEGKMKSMPVNIQATVLARNNGWKSNSLLPNDVIVGPVLVCSREQID